MTVTKPESILKNSPFIEQLKEDYYVICPKELLYGYPNLTMQEKLAYLYLIQYGLYSIINGIVDEEGNPIIYASQERLAKDMSVSQSTISRYMRKLEKEGLLSIHSQGNGSNNYVILYTPKRAKTYAPVNNDLCMDAYEPMHGCIQEIKYIEKRENENSDAEHPRGEFVLKTSRKSKRKEPSDTPTVDDILSGVGLKKPKPKKAKVKPTVPLEETIVHDRRNAQTLLEHYVGQYEKTFNQTPIVTKGKDMKLLKTLIEAYGYDKAVALIDYAILHYETFRREKGIKGYPTVGTIYGFRNYLDEKSRIFDDAVDTTSTDAEDESWF